MNVKAELVTVQPRIYCDDDRKLGNLTGAFIDANCWTQRQAGASADSHGTLSLFQDDRYITRWPGVGQI